MRRRGAIVAITGVSLLVLIGGCASTSYERGHPAFYDNPEVKRVAVLPFGNEEITDTILEVLVHESSWAVCDRANLDRILREQNLQHSSRFDDATAIRIGKLAGVDVVVLGSYTGRRGAVKAIDVESGQYLVVRSDDLSRLPPGTSVRFHGLYMSRHLAPYTIERLADGRISYIWVGKGMDQIDPATYPRE